MYCTAMTEKLPHFFIFVALLHGMVDCHQHLMTMVVVCGDGMCGNMEIGRQTVGVLRNAAAAAAGDYNVKENVQKMVFSRR